MTMYAGQAQPDSYTPAHSETHDSGEGATYELKESIIRRGSPPIHHMPKCDAV